MELSQALARSRRKARLTRDGARRQLNRARTMAARRRASRHAGGRDLADPDVIQDPFAWFEDLRQHGSVHLLRRRNAWIVLDYDDVRWVLSRSDLFSSVSPAESLEPVLTGAPGETRTMLRSLFHKFLGSDRVERLGAEARTFASTLIQSRPVAEEFDVVSMLAAPLADYVGARLLGLDTGAIQSLTSPPDPESPTPKLELFEALSAQLAQFPGGVPMADEVQRVTSFNDAQVLGFIRGFWIAAAVTTRVALPSAVLLVLQDPTLQDRVRADLALVPHLVDEALRLHPPGVGIRHIAAVDTPVRGAPIKAGDVVYARLDAANRDPKQFEDPTSVHLDRPVRHLTFGSGSHRCPGARLARLTIAAGIAALLGDTTKRLRETQSLTTVRWADSEMFHGVERLAVTWA